MKITCSLHVFHRKCILKYSKFKYKFICTMYQTFSVLLSYFGNDLKRTYSQNASFLRASKLKKSERMP